MNKFIKKFILLCTAMLFIFAAFGCTSSATSDNTGLYDRQQQNTTGSAQKNSSADAEQQKQAGSGTESAAGSGSHEGEKGSAVSQSGTVSSAENRTGTDGDKQSTATIGEKSKKNPVVTIEMEDGQKIVMELYPTVAPNTVRNFISLVNKGLYNGLTFHRVVPGFMIQGGDPNGNGSGGPGYNIKGEFSSNGFANNLKHQRGVISMARTRVPDSAGSQFFIMVADNSALDGQYAAFGKVLSGMEEVDKIVNVPNSGPPSNSALNPPKMKNVTVDTFGVKYGDPVKIQQ